MTVYVRACMVALLGVAVLFLLTSAAPSEASEPFDTSEPLEDSETLETAESFKFAKKIKKLLWPFFLYPPFIGPWG